MKVSSLIIAYQVPITVANANNLHEVTTSYLYYVVFFVYVTVHSYI